MNNTAKQTIGTARDLAKKIARQVAQEPLEVLKDARDQVTASENVPSNTPPKQAEDSQNKNPDSQQKLQDNMRSARRMEALNQEIKDIHKQNIFKDLQDKVSQGIEVPLGDYPELSMEQKQVLMAQMEAVKKQKETVAQTVTEVPSVHSKPSRRFGAGQKQEAEKQQTRVEKPVPPSG